ncbi:hypothetical protein BaRGS_00020391 [Batillaria attramentaria]|uniref:Telomeric single stranded DNA binding POT1/Cdc13 domain-containing protein n=1 Tax=Batillaria attramentaria TaxID=370345 RepID=A0ABD0KMM2_9CAEN
MSENGAVGPENETYEQSVVTVVAVDRYMTDPVFVQQTGLTGHYPKSNDAYDLTVADGHHRCKLVLSPTFNHLIQKRKVHLGSTIRLTKVKVRYDEMSLSGPGIPVVEDLEVVGETDQNLEVLCNLPWRNSDSSHEEYPQPLASSRAYYVDLWSSADVAKTADTVKVLVKTSLEEVTASDLYSLREVAKNWRSVKQCKPRLLLRVMRRPRLVHYARPEKSDKWPFQLPLVVGDVTGCCVAVLWNIMACRYLQHVQEGTILLVRNFTVKPRFQMPEHQVWHPVGLACPSVLEDLPDVDLPLPATNFVTRRQLSFLPDDFVCDVAGVITFVGAIQREKMKVKQGSDSGGFWIKRWVHIQDHSSQWPIVVQLYRGTQQVEFEDKMVAGQVLVCRHVRVVRGLSQLQLSRQRLHVHVSSTRDTQLHQRYAGTRLVLHVHVSSTRDTQVQGWFFMFMLAPPEIRRYKAGSSIMFSSTRDTQVQGRFFMVMLAPPEIRSSTRDTQVQGQFFMFMLAPPEIRRYKAGSSIMFSSTRDTQVQGWFFDHVHVNSTRDTQIYVHQAGEDTDFPFADDTTLHAVLNRADTATCHSSGGGRLLGMFFSYPPQPTSLEAFSDLHENVEIVPSDGWKPLVENLSYREATCIVVQARLAAVSFHRRTTTASRPRHTRKGASMQSGEPSELDTCEHLGYVGVHQQVPETRHTRPTPSSSTQGPDVDGVFAGQEYFCLQWRGLNADTVLNTVKIVNLSSRRTDLTLQSLLSGVHDAGPGETSIQLGEDTVQRLLASAKAKGHSSSERYLVVLDVYCVDGCTVLMSVNRAFPVR